MIIWPTFKSKWWTKITWGSIPSVSEYHWDLPVNYHTSEYEVSYHCVENDSAVWKLAKKWCCNTCIMTTASLRFENRLNYSINTRKHRYFTLIYFQSLSIFCTKWSPNGNLCMSYFFRSMRCFSMNCRSQDIIYVYVVEPNERWSNQTLEACWRRRHTVLKLLLLPKTKQAPRAYYVGLMWIAYENKYM